MQLDRLDGALYAGDPEPAYAWLRERAPLYRDEANGLWAVSRHADLVAIETDPLRFSSARGYRPKLPPDASMIGKDDPEHLAQRRLVNRRFTPRAVAALEPRIRATAARLVDALARRGRGDLVAGLAAPLPVIAILSSDLRCLPSPSRCGDPSALANSTRSRRPTPWSMQRRAGDAG